MAILAGGAKYPIYERVVHGRGVLPIHSSGTREGCTPSIHSSVHKQYNRVATHYGKVVT